MARVAVLILNYNGEQHLKKFLPSLIANSLGCEVIVGDNDSTDNSLELLENDFPEIRIIKLDKNYGYAGGYNKLIEQLDNEYIALVNSDIEATQGWITPLVSILDSNTNVAAVQPKIRSYNNREKFEYAGAGGGYMDQYGYPFCRGRVFDAVEEDKGQYNDTCDVFWASGACFVIRKSVFDEFHGFDDAFFAHMEEIDLCWQINNAGYRIKYCGESIVYHLGGGTLSYANPRKTYLNFRNNLSLLYKNIPKDQLVSAFIVRFILDGVAALKFFLEGGFHDLVAVLEAHLYFYRNFGKLKKKRKMQKQNKVSKVYNRNIVFDYFIKGKKKYTDLDSKEFT